jgi:hypothetical protein
MNNQLDNLLRLINKYSTRFGEQDPLVMDLKKEVTKIQCKKKQLIVHRSMLFPSDVKEFDLEETV